MMTKWTTPTFRIIDNIYYVGTDGLAAYLIKTSGGLILIDTAIPQSTALIEDSIRRLGFKISDVKQA